MRGKAISSGQLNPTWFILGRSRGNVKLYLNEFMVNSNSILVCALQKGTMLLSLVAKSRRAKNFNPNFAEVLVGVGVFVCLCEAQWLHATEGS